jgi:predicted porin
MTQSPSVLHKPRAALALLATALAGAAQAQSTVTVFGIVDAAARQVCNQGKGSIRSLVSGANNTSRLGFRGSEDLGGGLSAGFHLETGISVDTGASASSTLFWDRRSTVSLSGGFGEIRAGRDFVPTYTAWVRHDPFAFVGVGASSVLLGASPTSPSTGLGTPPVLRTGNAVQWLLPRGWGGFDGGLMVTAGEGGKATDGQHKLISGRLAYAIGGLSLTGALGRTQNDLTTIGKFEDSVLGARYDFGEGRVSVAQRTFSYPGSRQKTLIVSGVMPLGAHELKLSVLSTKLSGKVGATTITGNDATHVAVGYVHNLSKRTALYTAAARINNKGAATFVIAGGPTPVAGRSSTGFEGGIRHNF